MKNSFRDALHSAVLLLIMIDETKCLHHALDRHIFEFVLMRCRKKSLFEQERWFESELMEGFLLNQCVSMRCSITDVCRTLHLLFLFCSFVQVNVSWTCASSSVCLLCHSLTVYRCTDSQRCSSICRENSPWWSSRPKKVQNVWGIHLVMMSRRIDDEPSYFSRPSAQQFECLPSWHVQLWRKFLHISRTVSPIRDRKTAFNSAWSITYS